MKAPATADIASCLADPAAFDSIIDVRSPSEFALDRIPGAINLPVLDDEQRARVGTLYKQVGGFEAKRVGAALVARNIARALESELADKPRNWRALIYCWRGGNRSGAMATVLSRVGWSVTLVDGGYRSFRRLVNEQLQTLPAGLSYRIVAGRTGSAKSVLLRELAARGAQVLDLEELACHRGSVLGVEPDQPQPSQKWFETQVWARLRSFDPRRPVYVESESKKVGQNHVPDALIIAMRASSCIVLDASLTFRIEHLIEEYRHFVDGPESLLGRLRMLSAMHGSERIAHWERLVREAQWQELVADLLQRHYDPLYDRSMKRNFSRLPLALVVPVDGSAEHSVRAAAARILESESY